MQLIPQHDDLNKYLESSDIVNFEHSARCNINSLSSEIKACSKDSIDFIKNAYEFVRDKIAHSADINGKIVTCKASEVLQAKEGICFAKSHLLAALLRSNGVPTGLCYQKILFNDKSPDAFVLHGLNAVYIETYKKWVRLDARGNKEGVNAQFSLYSEKLAFSLQPDKGEEDIPIIFSYPDKNVVSALANNQSFETLWSNLPTKLDYFI